MSNDRNAFAEKLKRLMNKPQLLLQMCMEEHEARVRAEQRAHELERQCEAQAVIYRDLKGEHAALEKEAAFSRKALAGYEAKLAAATETGADFRKRYEAAAGENDLLKQANRELTERFADTVETGRKTQEKLEEAQAENRGLQEKVKALQEQVTPGNRDRFGSGSADPDAVTNETEENRTGDGTGKPGDYSAEGVLKKLRQKKEGRRKGKGSSDRKKPARRKGKREEDLSRMDQVNFYNYDFRKLDEQYGKGKYRIVRFNRTREIRETRPHNYVYNEYTPVVVEADDTQLERSPRLKEVVTYAINQETNLKVFLENGDVPIDNGYVERSVKPVALSRRNSLFSCSMIGAECNAIMYTIVETAKANGADVYTYLKYLLHEVPRHLDGTDRSFLDDMMPWSEKYLMYERHERECHADEHMPDSMDPPEVITTGRKR